MTLSAARTRCIDSSRAYRRRMAQCVPNCHVGVDVRCDADEVLIEVGQRRIQTLDRTPDHRHPR